MKNNVTGINKKITILADVIQKARITVATENNDVIFSSDDTRRIILVCLLFLQLKEKHIKFKSITMLEVLSEFSINNDAFFSSYIQKNHQKIELAKTLNILLSIHEYDFGHNLLNYSLESLEYDPNEYFNVKLTRGTRNSNIKKKSRGIYYTPIDVVDFMVSQCVSTILEINTMPSLLDCSCGSGVFLLQSLKFLDSALNQQHKFNTSLEILEKCIWGIDISQAAIECCKIVFMRYYIEEYQATIVQLESVWNIISHSLFVGDSLQLGKVVMQHSELPEQFDCIIGNPPYVTIGKESNLCIPFVENIISYSSSQNCSALILPLSICYSQGKGYVSLRNKIQNDNAKWTFMNYDRSPDSLFGDQVKTRNTILFRNNILKESIISTTTLQRWSSEKRNMLFKEYLLCDISGITLSNIVPKLSHSLEKQAFNILSSGSSNMKELSISCHSDYALVLNGTAYNWICAYDHVPPSTDEKGNNYVSSASKVFYYSDKESRDFCIALLSNRIAYWYWIVIGDGFHLNSSFLVDYKVSKKNFTMQQYEKLCLLGKEYAKRVKEYPTIAYNAGKRIVNYSHWNQMDLIEKIEDIIINALGLPDGFPSYIRQWYFDQVNCDRNNEKR